MRCLLMVGGWIVALGLARGDKFVRADEAAVGRHEALKRAATVAPDPKFALEGARQRLEQSTSALRTFLAGGGKQKEELWAQWLKLPQLEEQLIVAQPDTNVLSEHLERLHLDRAGLELPQFVAVRQDLRQLLAATEYSTAGAPDELFRRQLTELSECLGRLDIDPTANDAQRAGRIVAWLEALGPESAELAASLRRDYCRTNAVGQMSARLVNLLLERDVVCQQVIAEMMLGSYMQGVAHTRANLTIGFLPSSEHATLDLRMRGHVASPANVAQRRRVSVHTSAGTAISGSKQVFLNERGFQLARATAAGATNVRINDVDAGRRVVERLAWRKAGRMTPQAEAAASQRAGAEAGKKLDEQAAEGLAGVNNLFRQQIRSPLIRRDALPNDWRFWTDREHLRVSLTQQNDRQLAAASAAPQFPADYDVAVAAHESMIVNLSEAMLGGETIQDNVWLEFSKHLVGSPPPALRISDLAPRWSVTLERELPIVARFVDDRIDIRLRLAKVTRGENVFECPMEINARYLPQSIDGCPTLVREGQIAVRVEEPTNSEESQRTAALLAEKFDAIIPPKLNFDGMSMPAGGTLGKLKSLQLVEFASTNGWVKIAYELQGEGEMVARRPGMAR